jgi:hypothetical protein
MKIIDSIDFTKLNFLLSKEETMLPEFIKTKAEILANGTYIGPSKKNNPIFKTRAGNYVEVEKHKLTFFSENTLSIFKCGK